MKTSSKPENVGPVISVAPAKRRHRSKLERRQIVEETLVPGASVAVIARNHGVNANQVFLWRKMYREGQLDVPGSETQFLPARIIEPKPIEQRRAERKPDDQCCGVIDIEIGSVRVRITGSADPGCVRAALERLR